MQKVYHTKNWELNSALHFIKDTELVDWKFNREDYEMVAGVIPDDKEVAFQFTNSIDKPWWENPKQVVLPVKTETRSTSVGDLIEDRDGQLWMCACCGWEKVSWAD